MAVITVWTDIFCPWSYVAVVRLHRARDRLSASVDFDIRAWPPELTGQPWPAPGVVMNEVAALAQRESSLFSAYEGSRWPGSSMPAFEAQKWGFAQGQETGEKFDLALRRAFFLHSRDLSSSTDLVAVAVDEALAADSLAEALGSGAFRSAVTADVASGAEIGVEGTPQLDLPGNISHVNPGVTHRWVRGIPVIEADHAGVYDDIVRGAALDD